METSHKNADALSRRPCPPECSHCSRLEDKEAALYRTTVVNENWLPAAIKQEQEKDPELRKLREWKKANRRPSWQEVAPSSQTLKAYWSQWDSLVLEDDLLKRNLESDDGSDNRMQLVIPRSRVSEVLGYVHDGTSGGHLGVRKTLQRVRERFYWVNCGDDVRKWSVNAPCALPAMGLIVNQGHP